MPPPPVDPIPSYDDGLGAQRSQEIEITDSADGRCVPIAYGRVKFRPNCIFFTVSAVFVEAVYLLGEGPIESVEKIWLNGEEVYPTTSATVTTVIRLGTTSQTEITEVSNSQWASIYPGYALLYLRALTSELTPGIPQLEVDVKGRKLYDSRAGATAWSENPILMLRDLLTSSDYGAGLTSDDLAEGWWNDAADVCDEVIAGTTNLLTANQSDVETNTTGLGVYQSSGSPTLARVTTALWQGSASAKATAASSTNLSILTTPNTSGLVAGRTYSFSVYARASATAARTMKAGIFWHTSGGVFISSSLGTAIAATTDWTRVTVTATAPPTAAQAYLAVELVGAQAGDEVWWDGAQLEAGAVTAWTQGGTTRAADTRYRASVVIAERTPAERLVLDLLRLCMGRIWEADGKIYVACDTTGDSLWTITDDGAGADEIPLLRAPTFSRSYSETPNTVRITYLDTSTWEPDEAVAETSAVQAGNEQPRELRIDMLEIPSRSQAYRLAVQWLRISQHTLRVTCRIPQHGIQIAPGDLLTITAETGPLTAEVMRVAAVTASGDGEYDLDLQEYDADDYSDDTMSAAGWVTPDSRLSDDVVVYRDDFRSGAIDGSNYAVEPFGDLGWAATSASGTSYGWYTSEADHPGILKIQFLASSSGSIALEGNHQKFARNSKYHMRALFRVDGKAGTATYTFAFGDVLTIQVNASGTVSINGSSTGKNAGDSDWIDAQLSCAGDGTAVWDVRWASEIKTGSKAVATTTIDQQVAQSWSTSAGSQITSHIDLFTMALPSAR